MDVLGFRRGVVIFGLVWFLKERKRKDQLLVREAEEVSLWMYITEYNWI